MKYVPISVILAVIGTACIGFGTNELQENYQKKYGGFSDSITYVIKESQENNLFEVQQEDNTLVPFNKNTAMLHFGYWVISYAQYILMPLWMLVCVYVPGIIFYKRELKKPISILMEASRKNCGKSA